MTLSKESARLLASLVRDDAHSHALAHQDEFMAFKKAETLKNMQKTTKPLKRRTSRKERFYE